MRTLDVYVELALDTDGKKVRQIPVRFVSENVQAQAEVDKRGYHWLLYNGIWMIDVATYQGVTGEQFRLGREVALTAHVPRRSWHQDYTVGDYMSVQVAQVLHLFGYLRKSDVSTHLAAHRVQRDSRAQMLEKQQALDNIFDAIQTLGINVVQAEVEARVKMAGKSSQ